MNSINPDTFYKNNSKRDFDATYNIERLYITKKSFGLLTIISNFPKLFSYYTFIKTLFPSELSISTKMKWPFFMIYSFNAV